MKLEEIISKYGVPDPKIVGKLPKGGMQLDFVGHADVPKALSKLIPHGQWNQSRLTRTVYQRSVLRTGWHTWQLDDHSRCPSFGCWFGHAQQA
jgi:hypothetical protein